MRFEGALQAFGQSLVADDDPRPVYALLDLLQPEKLDQMLMQTYGPELMPRHLPVLVSQWSKYYFMHLIPLVVVAVLVQGWCWPLALEGIGVSLDSRGLPDGVKLPEQGAAVAVESFDGLLDHNLQPVIESLSAYSGVGGGVLWGNAGDYLETCLRQLADVSDVPLDAGYALLRNKQRSDGRRNPLFNAITYPDQRRQRRSCCLSYQVEWIGHCEHCPLV